jgi:hypothetical protein
VPFLTFIQTGFKCPIKSIAYAEAGSLWNCCKVRLNIFFLYSLNVPIILTYFKHCSIGLPINGSAPAPQTFSLPIGNPGLIPALALPTQIMPTQVAEPVGTPSNCLLLKNMFDPTTEVWIN